MSAHLVIIDPQNDFCDPERGSLYVKGAEKDMAILANFIRAHGESMDAIHLSLDSHQTLHIAHPIFWKDPQGNHPGPFTTITRAEVETGKWTTSRPDWAARGLAYVRALERNRRYQLTIWPPHCRIGTWGHGIYPVLSDALIAWEEKYLRNVKFLLKGSNMFTEHYSAIAADVRDEGDPSTWLNKPFLEQLKTADRVFFAGEALSHCVANTITDIADHVEPEEVRKFVLLRDAASSVTGCESLSGNFLEKMTGRGLHLGTAAEF